MDMECGTFKEVKKLLWDKVEWKQVIASNHSYEMMLMMTS